MPRTRYQIFEKAYPYFMTSTVVAWLPVFVRPEFVDILFDSWRFLQRERDITIFGYVVMENHELMLQKLEYMHNNPKRRGYIDDPTHWRYSSARNYAGMQGLLEVETDWR